MSIISSVLKVKNYSADEAANLLHIPKNGKKLFIEKMNNGNCFFYAIVVFNKTLGRIILFTDLDDKDLADGKNVCYFSNLWVHPKLRGHKIGSKLVRYVEKQAKEKGFKYLTLGVHTDNKKNVSIYKHLGFDIVVKNKTQDVLVKDENGDYITVKEHSILKKSIK
ncbi:MAG: GNAT family N-acetyltransferase [Clostridia bacterium]|nr:GNAT family N-acetyltransferase [Clostridia bacterium]